MRAPLAALPGVAFPQRGTAGFVDIPGAEPLLAPAVAAWVSAGSLQLEIDGKIVSEAPVQKSARFALEGDPLFGSKVARMPETTEVNWAQVQFDAELEYPVSWTGNDSMLRIRWQVARDDLRVHTTIVWNRRVEYNGNPGWIALNPSSAQIAGDFGRSGFVSFAKREEVLLAMAALLLTVRRRTRRILPILGGFAFGHTLAFLWSAVTGRPETEPLWWNTLLQLSCAALPFYAALENIAHPAALRWRWALAFAGGTLCGSSLVSSWREKAQFAGDHSALALAACTGGTWLAIACIAIPLFLLLRIFTRWNPVRMLLSASIAHSAWHAILEHGEALSRYSVPAVSDWDSVILAGITRTLLVCAGAAGIAWLYGRLLIRRPRAGSSISSQ